MQLSLTELLEEYRRVYESYGAKYRRFWPLTESDWEAISLSVGKSKAELPAELIEWGEWSDPVDLELGLLPWLHGNYFPPAPEEVDFWLNWRGMVPMPEADPDREVVPILSIAACRLFVSTRDSHGGSVWYRANDGRSGLGWSSIAEMVRTMTEFISTSENLVLLTGSNHLDFISTPDPMIGWPKGFIEVSGLGQ